MASSSCLSFGRIKPTTTAFFLCDVQEKFRSSIQHFNDVITVSKRMVDAGRLMKVPIIVTEQYPKGLGHTVSEIDVNGLHVFEKTVFSMMCPPVKKMIVEGKRITSVVLFGIEAHVCVQQTALDLIEEGLDVHVLTDGISSRSLVDRNVALERMRQSGAFITSSESVLFEMMGSSMNPLFRDIQKLVK